MMEVRDCNHMSNDIEGFVSANVTKFSSDPVFTGMPTRISVIVFFKKTAQIASF